MKGRALIDRRNYAQQVYEALRHEIITLQLVPGQRIEINMVAERFSVSATPVREALKQLAERGLLQVEPNVHYRVVSLDE
ncbi:MAG: GntR family transcriptional regulator, partial [Clostridia bacterium]|nr:GntR family transcriptional regulator [Clostridia bacterium]